MLSYLLLSLVVYVLSADHWRGFWFALIEEIFYFTDSWHPNHDTKVVASHRQTVMSHDPYDPWHQDTKEMQDIILGAAGRGPTEKTKNCVLSARLSAQGKSAFGLGRSALTTEKTDRPSFGLSRPGVILGVSGKMDPRGTLFSGRECRATDSGRLQADTGRKPRDLGRRFRARPLDYSI